MCGFEGICFKKRVKMRESDMGLRIFISTS